MTPHNLIHGLKIYLLSILKTLMQYISLLTTSQLYYEIANIILSSNLDRLIIKIVLDYLLIVILMIDS